jgi:hypothetical protein
VFVFSLSNGGLISSFHRLLCLPFLKTACKSNKASIETKYFLAFFKKYST